MALDPDFRLRELRRLVTGIAGSSTTLTGDVTGSGSGSIATTIANDAVTFAKMQNVAANSVPARAAGTSGDLSEVTLAASQLFGRGSSGDLAPISLGSGLSMSATTLSSSGSKLNPRYEAYFCEDYLRGGGVSSTNNGTNFIQSDSAITYVSGTGAGPSFTAAVGRPGQLVLSTGTSANGYSRHFVSGGLRYKFGGGVINVGTTIVLSNLSNSGQRYQLAFGFFDVISGATNNRVDAVYQDDINGGNWRLRAINAGVITEVDTATVGPAAGVETRVELEINAAGTLATLRIDGTSVATVALSNSATMGLGLAISKSIGNSAVTVTPNYIEFGQVYTTPM